MVPRNESDHKSGKSRVQLILVVPYLPYLPHIFVRRHVTLSASPSQRGRNRLKLRPCACAIWGNFGSPLRFSIESHNPPLKTIQLVYTQPSTRGTFTLTLSQTTSTFLLQFLVQNHGYNTSSTLRV